jgi:hypothetical protein
VARYHQTRTGWSLIFVGATLVAAMSVAAEAAAKGGPGPAKGPLPRGTQIIPPPRGTLQPAPGKKGHPSIWITARTNSGQYGPYAYPFNFKFHEHVSGANFQPGERVTIGVEHATTPAVSLVADGQGKFATTVPFTWIFCGPGGTRSPSPVLIATGNHGSKAETSESPPPCPELVALTTLPKVRASGPVRFNGLRAVTFAVQGFGFQSGERVSVRVVDLGKQTVPAPTTAITDSVGRFRFSLRLSLALPCGSSSASPELDATGDKGTAAIARVFWYEPLLLCPARSGLASSLGNRSPWSAQADSDLLAMSLHPYVVSPMSMDRALIQTAGAGTARLIISYPAGRRSSWTVRVGSSARTALRWRIPSGLTAGDAVVSLAVNPGTVSLHSRLLIR